MPLLSKEIEKKLEILSIKYQGKISKEEITEAAITYFQEHKTLKGFDIETLIETKNQSSNKQTLDFPALQETAVLPNSPQSPIDDLNVSRVEINSKHPKDIKNRNIHHELPLPPVEEWKDVIFVEWDGKRPKDAKRRNVPKGNVYKQAMNTVYNLISKCHDLMVEAGAVSTSINSEQGIAEGTPPDELRGWKSCPENFKQLWARSAIGHNLIILGDLYPKDKEFWQGLKTDYLKDKNHSAENWEKLTAHIPDEIMGREKLSAKEKLDMLSKQGINPNLEAPKKQNITPTKLNISQLPSKQQSIGS